MKPPFLLVTLQLALGGIALHAQGTRADYDRANSLGEKIRDIRLGDQSRLVWPNNGESVLQHLQKPSGDLYRSIDLKTGAIREITREEFSKVKPASREIPIQPYENTRTRQSGDAQDVEFQNATAEPITLSWIGQDGGSKSYGVIDPGKSTTQSTYAGHLWSFADAAGKPFGMIVTPDYPGLARISGKPEPKTRRGPGRAPNGELEAAIRGDRIQVRRLAGGEPETLVEAGANEHLRGPLDWSPDSKNLIFFREKNVTERKVTLVESSPKDQLQPKVTAIDYAKPGDEIAQPFPRLVNIATRKEIAVDTKLFPNPWSISEGEWAPDSSEYTFVYNQRGHQLMRILGIRASDGNVRVIHEEKSDTFIDYSQKFYIQRLPQTREILWMSEKDGWNHLYLIDEVAGKVKQQITRGTWNVREVEDVDAAKRRITFKAVGIIPGQDPYYTQYARVNFDGGGQTLLTSSNGTHAIKYSPDSKYLIDTWSRVDQPPVTEIRNAETGKLVSEISRADDAELRKTGWSRPEPFVAKGRDGKTDIHGVILKPSNFDPSKRYPVIENIYSGPHDFFVPKRFYPWTSMNNLAELGFILVQIDGMGTNWRSRAFHDVAWKNLADAGLPDHIAWLKAAAATRPWMDLKKVGIYGGSAGGQNSLSAMLHHGDFYKACVSDCGCHDNRMDKIWWNEAWMGWPVDDSYVKNSNVTDAAKLQGKLLLVVGEIDHNVDPSSTLQVANALQKADKDFELLIITGADHGAAETPYGKRRRADFFVRNLLGVEPRR